MIESYESFHDWAKEIKKQVDDSLARFLALVGEELVDSSAHPVIDELSRVVFAGGKRLRPMFCCLGFSSGGRKCTDRVINAAASLELLHTLAIVHDDFMDGSWRRRGVATTMHSRSGRTDEARPDKAASMAVLVGDLAFVLSDRLFAESGFAPEALAKAWPALNRLRQDAIAGQYLDISGTGALPAVKTSEAIARLKTGSYSIKGPLLMGAALAAAPTTIQAALAAFGEAAGLAFQYTDDLLGIFGQTDSTGKDVDSDIRLGKPTRLVARAMELMQPGPKRDLAAIFGNPKATAGELEKVRKILIDCGAKRQTEEEAGRLFEVAIDAVRSEPTLDEATGRALVAIAETLRFRES